MAEQHIVKQKNRTKESDLVVPLDELRSMESAFKAVVSGAWEASGVLYAIDSGKNAYIKQITISETSDIAGTLEIGEPISGGATQLTGVIPVTGGQLKTIDTCIGPATSGFVVMSGNPIDADITLVVQVDPNVPE